MAEVELETPTGIVRLRRPHTGTKSPLRAWSSADELAIAALDDPADLGSTLIVNDSWGALTVALAPARPVLWNDSVLARGAIAANLADNGLELPSANFLTGVQVPRPAVMFDTVVVAVPKTLSLLEYQLDRVAAVVSPATRVVGLGMARHIHRSTIAAFESRLGPTTTTRATKKARLILTEADGAVLAQTLDGLGSAAERADGMVSRGAFRTPAGILVATAPGVFAGDRLDPGTELLLDHLQEVDLGVLAAASAGDAEVADLGCGNGVVATTLAARAGVGAYSMFDVSDLAMATARCTWADNVSVDGVGARSGAAEFLVADGLGAPTPAGPERFDLIVTNPPFHQDHALDPALTDRLLAQAASRLKASGTLAVVAQRHLNLHRRLARWFGAVETVSAHRSHVVLFAGEPKG